MAKGALMGGIPGAIIGGVRSSGMLDNAFKGPGLFSPLSGGERFGVGSAGAAMYGPRGATYTASNGSILGGLGNGYSTRTSGTYGWTETVDPSGSVIGIDYGKGGGLASIFSGMFDGGKSGGKSK